MWETSTDISTNMAYLASATLLLTQGQLSRI